MTINEFLNKLNTAIINPLIVLVFAVATIVFVFGIVQFIKSETADKEREAGKKKIMYGLLGMFIMFSAYGLIHIVLGTFGIPGNSSYISF
jgi:flagellar basal body-associated protein FliL